MPAVSWDVLRAYCRYHRLEIRSCPMVASARSAIFMIERNNFKSRNSVGTATSAFAQVQ
jgi:hypothetical protein